MVHVCVCENLYECENISLSACLSVWYELISLNKTLIIGLMFLFWTRVYFSPFPEKLIMLNTFNNIHNYANLLDSGKGMGKVIDSLNILWYQNTIESLLNVLLR